MTDIRNLFIFALTSTLLLVMPINVAADSQEDLHPKADALLKKMSDYMGGLKSFSADASLIEEQIMADGFKMSILQSGSIKVQRPDKFYISREGEPRNQETYYDGTRLVILDKELGRFIDVPVTGDIDTILDTAADTFNARIPGRDLFGSNAYAELMKPVEESNYLGTAEINGVTCRQLAFRTDEVDWQLWIAEGDRPLPCRYTITSKWIYAAPQYTVTYTNWKINPALPSDTFDFTAPDDAKPMTMKEYKMTLGSEGSK